MRSLLTGMGDEPQTLHGTYDVLAECQNCYWKDVISVPRRLSVPNKLCPRCGCAQLISLRPIGVPEKLVDTADPLS